MHRGAIKWRVIGRLFAVLLSNAALGDGFSQKERRSLTYFSDDYAQAMSKFLEVGKQFVPTSTGSLTWSEALPEWGPGGRTEFAFFPSSKRNEKRLLIISSGVHGIDGPGFATKSRYSENRVDLNRSWFVGAEFPKDLDDGGYGKFNEFFNPTYKAAFGRLDFAKFALVAVGRWAKSMLTGAMTKAAGIGQYRFPNGIMYGGSNEQPNKSMVEKVLRDFISNYIFVMAWDVHTGLGKKQMQFLPNPPYDSQIDELRHRIFEVEGRAIEETGGVDFYASHGDFSDYVCQLTNSVGGGTTCVSMLMEFGTLLPPDWKQRKLGQSFRNMVDQLYTLYVMIRENQLFHYGPVSKRDALELRHAYDELFYPIAKSWRQMVIDESRLLMPKIIDRVSEL